MKKLTTLLSMVLFVTWAGAVAAQPAGFAALVKPYEEIRQALLYDNVDGVADRAREILTLASTSAPTDDAAGDETCRGGSDACDGITSEIHRAASRLQSAGSLAESREAFGDLSRALVNYRQVADGPEPVVAYCSMAQKVWLQPKGEIGNPYYGQSMATCGEIVSE